VRNRWALKNRIEQDRLPHRSSRASAINKMGLKRPAPASSSGSRKVLSSAELWRMISEQDRISHDVAGERDEADH